MQGAGKETWSRATSLRTRQISMNPGASRIVGVLCGTAEGKNACFT